jgi:Mrp family chromosome partitioning ATPase
LKRSGARVVGVVLNRIPRSHTYSYGGYRSVYNQKGYGQYYIESEHEAPAPAASVPAPK